MATLATDAFTGTNGAAWSAGLWTLNTVTSGTPPTPDIQSNAGRMRSGTANYAFARAYLSGMTASVDTDVTYTLTFSTQSESYMLTQLNSTNNALAADSFYAATGYAFQINCGSAPGTGGGMALFKFGPSDTAVTSKAFTALTVAAGTTYKWRVQRVGAVLRGRFWAAAGAEPATWDLSWTDPGTLLGANKVLLSYSNGSGTGQTSITVDDLTVTDGATGPATISASGTAAGTLTATRTPVLTQTAALTAAGTLTATRTPILTRTAAVSATGTLTATLTRLVSAGLSAIGTLTAELVLPPRTDPHAGAGVLAGDGVSTAVLAPTLSGAVLNPAPANSLATASLAPATGTADITI